MGRILDAGSATSGVDSAVGSVSNPISGPFGGGNVRWYSSNGTFTVPDGVTSVRVRVWGGGANGYTDRGGGGGSFALKKISGLAPGSNIPVTVGIGGSTGGTSSFGPHVSAAGGSTQYGGTASGGDIVRKGGDGGNLSNAGNGGGGAGNLFGDGGKGQESGASGGGGRGDTQRGHVGGSGFWSEGGRAHDNAPQRTVIESVDWVGAGGGGGGSHDARAGNGINGGGGGGSLIVGGDGGWPGGGGGGGYSGGTPGFGADGLVIVEW